MAKTRKMIELLLVLVVAVVLLSLGNWQMSRLSQKKEFISSIEESLVNPPLEISLNEKPRLYSKIQLNGHFLSGQDIFLYGRRTAYPEKDGYYLLTPFKVDNGDIYLVSRGWMPHSVKLHYDSSNQVYSEETITTIVLSGEKKRFLVPDNDLAKRVWFTLDLKQAKENLGTTIDAFYLMQIDAQTLPEGLVPLTTTHMSKVRNDHLEYAITWYSLASALLIMYAYYRYRSLKS